MIAPHFGNSPGVILGVRLHVARVLGHRGASQRRFSNKRLSVWPIGAGYQIASVAIMAVVPGLSQ